MRAIIHRALQLAFLCAALIGAGCASRVIDAATTKLEIAQGKNRGVSFTFPKELDAKDFVLSVDPKTNVITLKAADIKTSSQGVIDRAAAAQSAAMAEMSKSVSALVSTILPLVAPQLSAVKAVAAVATPPAEDTPAQPADPAPVSTPAPEATFIPVDPATVSLSAK